MIIFNKIKRVIERPERLMLGLQLRWAHYTNNQKLLVNSLYRLHLGKKLNLDSPRTFTEKLQWLKLYDHNPIYHKMVDKYEVKKIVAKRIGAQYIIPTLGIWDCFDDIDFEALPNLFVLKTTNGGGSSGVVICIDKSTLDKQAAKDKLERSLSNDIYKSMGEWAYKDVSKRILAEKFIAPIKNGELRDYKFFCFNGKVHFYKVDFNRFVEHHANYYDANSILMPFGETICPPDYNIGVEIPNNISDMMELAEKISKGHAFLRVDFYNVNGIIYFGETTFYPNSVFGEFEPKEWDLVIGKMLELPHPNGGGEFRVIYAWAA